MENILTLFFVPLLVSVLVLFLEYFFIIPLIHKHEQKETKNHKISSFSTLNESSNTSKNTFQQLSNNERFKSSIKGAFLGVMLSIASSFLIASELDIAFGDVSYYTIVTIVPLSLTGLMIGRNIKYLIWVLFSSIGFTIFLFSFFSSTEDIGISLFLFFALALALGLSFGGFFASLFVEFVKLFVRIMKW